MPALPRQQGALSSAIAETALPDGAIPAHARIMPPPPSPAVGLTRQGLALFAVGELRKAEQAFRTVVDVAPDHPLAWNNLALVLVGLEEPEEAASALHRSLQLDPAQLSTWNSLASTLLTMGRASAADQACAVALALDPNCAETWQTRAFARARADDFSGAAEAFSRAIDLAGESAPLYLNLGAALMKCGRFAGADVALSRALELNLTAAASEFKDICALILDALAGELDGPGCCATGQTFKTALLLLNGAQETLAASRVAEAWAQRFPENIEALHLRDAAFSRAVDRQPAALVAQHFDGIAEDFDERLVRRLGYRGPERLLSLLEAHLAPEGSLNVLDLGCGTGLCAPLLRPFARRLFGIDLSPRMLEKAKALGIYDSLNLADLMEALNGSEEWDLVIAADTFPYLGDLELVFADVARSLSRNGWFAFSTEAADGDGFVLNASGRYGHGPGYVARLASGRFDIVEQASAPLRREAGQAIVGDFFLLRATR